MSDIPIDPAHLLFPSDAPKEPPQWFVAQDNARQRPQAAQRQPEERDEKADAAKLFPSEKAPDEDHSAVGRLGDLAEAVRLAGDTERADQLIEASDTIMLDALEHGTPSAELHEIVGMVHEASSTLAPLSLEQLTDLNAKAERELADVPAEDLELGRKLIQQMSTKMDGLIYQLEATGLGSRPDFVRAVCREAKRRASR